MTPLLKIAWLSLRRDRAALALTFILPIAFFSVFAGIFGKMAGGSGGLPEVEVVVVDEQQSDDSRRFVEALRTAESLKGPGRDEPQPLLLDSRKEAEELVAAGKVDAAVVLPAGFSVGFAGIGDAVEPVTIFADTTANPVAHQVLQGLLQQLAFTAVPDLFFGSGLEQFEQFGGPMTEQQKEAIAVFLPQLEAASAPPAGEETASDGVAGEEAAEAEAIAGAMSPIVVEVEDVRRIDDSEKRSARLVAFQAAGIGVMFLLFSMTNAAGSLIEAEQTGTLERLLNSRLTMGGLVLGYWGFAVLLGVAQLVVMFVFGWAVFGLELWTPEHFIGFLIMTVATAAAAAAFGMILGTACRSQAQLSGLSTIIVLVMSAVGGSMVPRFLLKQNPFLDKLGLLTFNGWAIDGFQKVFWYETGLASLWPQVSVLVVITVVALTVSLRLARRWETV